LNFSNGAVYADLDNDGDLDLVVNKMNQEAGIYKNNTIENKQGGSFFKLQLTTTTQNKFALGAKVSVFTKTGTYTIENHPVHGFQSSMQIPMHFTFPDKKIDSVLIRWPDGGKQVITENLAINQQLNVQELTSSLQQYSSSSFTNTIFKTANPTLNYTHQEDVVNDFKIQPLMLNMISYSGPRIAKADINGDKLDDMYICGPTNQAGAIFLQQSDGSFTISPQPDFDTDAAAEDCGAQFFDADNDGDLDLYVVSGGYAVDDKDASLQDRLYFNEKGKFIKKINALPAETISGAQVVPMDFDADGDMDLFIAGRVIPGRYPESPGSYLLVNNGKGIYTDQTAALAPFFSSLGMVTDAKWADINGDKINELIICGEWIPLQCFSFANGKFADISAKIFDSKLNGLWNRLQLEDIDKDGDLDLIAGNWGTNSQLHATDTEPATMYYGDFDNNGFIDPLLCSYIEGKSYPIASRDEMTDQIVSLRQRFPTYDSYADATINDVLTPEQMKASKQLSLNYLHTSWFENVGGKFITHSLPIQADFSPVYAIQTADFNKDGNMDILLCGNIDQARVKIGKMDANYGVLLAGDGKGNFNYIPQLQSGLSVKGCVRDIISIKGNAGTNLLMLGLNNQAPVFLNY
jgi:hypothetical protein